MIFWSKRIINPEFSILRFISLFLDFLRVKEEHNLEASLCFSRENGGAGLNLGGIRSECEKLKIRDPEVI